MNRRDFLRRSTLLATTPLIPAFIERTARAAEPEKDTVLVVIEMTGGNDGLNTVIPFRDDNYYKMRPTIGHPVNTVLKLNDSIGIHPSLNTLKQMHDQGALTVVQGVGYPNPDRSHFESMDRWHCGEIAAKVSGNGWLAKSVPDLAKSKGGGVPVVHVGTEKLPMACRGTTQGVFTLNQEQPFELKLGLPGSEEEDTRKKLLKEVAGLGVNDSQELLPFVQRRHLQTYSAFDKLQKVMKESETERLRGGMAANTLYAKADLVGRLISQGFGTRVFYLAIDGFDTHSNQSQTHAGLMQQIDQAVAVLFNRLRGNGDDKRTLVMTFSEFGRRAAENGSKGTDHGSGSSMFLVGPGARGGPVGTHPSLTDLTDGDLKYHTDFRRVYATILDQWLNVDSKTVLGEKFEHMDLLRKRA
ncbi:DUF1501 domain-containing protein [Zavarzinella formosa]|uniref:DUF1501 domain-containing protein n=1 Tax=Zavarzinella formosa TaxID=360055 RepID=UPI00037AC7DA|nr:DUF1501 domain-containing protein [Zavarzinella formosa]